MSEFVNSPAKPIAPIPSGYGPTGGGETNGEKGYPKRTSSPNAVPEKTRDGAMPDTPKPTAPGSIGIEGND